MRKVLKQGVPEDKRRADDQKKLRSKSIPEDLEQRLVEVGGFSKPQIYNRRGGTSDRGLASLLEPGDKILEILPGKVRIQTREGTIQTFYNIEVEQEFLKRVPTDRTG